MAGFKAITTTRINQARGTRGAAVWQRGYDERIINNEVDLQRARNYIENNPREWKPK